MNLRKLIKDVATLKGRVSALEKLAKVKPPKEKPAPREPYKVVKKKGDK